MPHDSSDDRFPADRSSAAQEPAQQREQLLKKLNCLIAVLEAAISKVRKNQEDGLADPDRLERIRINLENTLTICQRARVTLEQRGSLPANLPPEVREAVGMPAHEAKQQKPSRRKADNRMSYRDYVEMSTFEEYRKFRSLPAISPNDVANCDFDKLASEFSDPTG
jgi:hypothetical protein